MSLRDIPVVTVGPGSQPKEDDGSQLEYIALPKEMSRYTMPDTPEPEEVADLIKKIHDIVPALAKIDAAIKQEEADLRDLMKIPNNYKVLFLQGGASSQFAMVPLNHVIVRLGSNGLFVNRGPTHPFTRELQLVADAVTS